MFSLRHICAGFSFEFDADKLKTALNSAFERMGFAYGLKRLSFIKALTDERVERIGQILADV
jgi:hypothetical protein